MRGGAGAGRPVTVAAGHLVAPPGAARKQIPFPGELEIIFSTLSYKLRRTVRASLLED